ncbi:MAG: hypothetical protein AAB224_10165 [Gemmatimonadota bacterium]
MSYIFNSTSWRTACGAALVTLIAGCSDGPSGLRTPLPGPSAQEQAASAVADVPLVEATRLRPTFGERRQRRSLRGADGQVLVVESVVGADGRPRASVITRNGIFVMRINNEWAPDAPSRLDRQQAYVRGPDGVLRSFDSRTIPAFELAMASEKLRSEAEQMSRPQAGRLRGLEADLGACDAEVNAANIATWQYVGAAATLIAASATGNFLAAGVAFTAYLASYANYTAKQTDLDKCVELAGKKRELDEY